MAAPNSTTTTVSAIGGGSPEVVGGSASSLVGFWGATPIVQPSGATQALPTGLTVSATAGRGFKSSAAYNNTIALITAMRAALVDAGLMKGAA